MIETYRFREPDQKLKNTDDAHSSTVLRKPDVNSFSRALTIFMGTPAMQLLLQRWDEHQKTNRRNREEDIPE
ncbi:hypothetical protein EU348_20460 [Chryseobacterium indologenes]|uniref:Uncharacterized protein n=1 Tax=Chryseobacterium indologenes TaxID=253 RepID=A0A411DSS3_CHRID|nr:hypothetical protein EU348_20460 [Chryseobacterium indologenes]